MIKRLAFIFGGGTLYYLAYYLVSGIADGFNWQSILLIPFIPMMVPSGIIGDAFDLYGWPLRIITILFSWLLFWLLSLIVFKFIDD